LRMPFMPSKIRYFLPNFFTAINFTLGLYAILLAAAFVPGQPKSEWTIFGHTPLMGAAWMIVWCNLMDKLDGVVARLLKAFSGFGAQFDSLADLIAFGAAPGFLVFFYLRHEAPLWAGDNLQLLVIALTLYVLCAAIRLARFNAKDANELSDVFMGMPSTLAGGLTALSVILFDKYSIGDRFDGGNYLLPILLIILGLLMVSPLYLPKIAKRKTKLLNWIQFPALLSGYVFGFGMIFPEYMYALLLIYAIVGFSYAFIHRAEFSGGRMPASKD
jgi:CDP-diacylglycerol---serine O-phosphatidyltransferase